jgi:endonuclease G
MSPQSPDLNREKWSNLEGLLRKYVIDKGVILAIVSAPILKKDLLKIKQSTNGVSIPEQFIKIAYDATNRRSIAFLTPNKKLPTSPGYYALSVDQLEEITGYNYFPNIDESIESSYNEDEWFKEVLNGDATPIKQNTLPKKHLNTTSAVSQVKSKKTIYVCGTVVGTRYSTKGHACLNLDKKIP